MMVALIIAGAVWLVSVSWFVTGLVLEVRRVDHEFYESIDREYKELCDQHS